MRAQPFTVEDKALEILGRYISPILARSIVSRAIAKAGVQGHAFASGDHSRLVDVLADAAKLFVDPGRMADLRRALGELGDSQEQRPTVAKRQFTIRRESDISIARTSAREMAESVDAPRYVAQRIATVVSELARNIVNYTPGGTIEILPKIGGGTRSITVRAVDEGKGIRNLNEIMAGDYVSKTGLGAGLRGSKRLADSFSIQTGESGTRIEAVFLL